MSETKQPTTVSIEEPFDVLAEPTPVAHVVNVEGEGGVISLNFHCAPQSLIDRILDLPPAGTSQREDEVVFYQRPMARVALPLTTAAELVVDLFAAITEQVPELEDALRELRRRTEGVRAGKEEDEGDE